MPTKGHGVGGYGQANMRREEGAGGPGTQKFVCQKSGDQIFPIVSFVFSRDGHFGLSWGGGPPMVGAVLM